MARVIVAPRAVADLDRLIAFHGLPENTLVRVQRSLRLIEQFPLAGRALHGEWDGLRFVIGPWSWMLIVYAFDADDDAVFVVTVQDGRSSTAAGGG